MKARHNIRVRGKIEEIKPSEINSIFLGMFAVVTLIALAVAVAAQ